MFRLYSEPEWVINLLFGLSLCLSFLIWITPLIILRNCYILNNNKKIPFLIVVLLGVLITGLNYLVNFQNIWIIMLSYLITCFVIYKSNYKKSLKRINIFLLIFILFILTVYFLMNYKLMRISYVFFNLNDITDFSFNIKPYLTLYRPNDLLGNVSFKLDEDNIIINNDVLLTRLFGVYTALNILTFLIWLSIYNVVIKKHGFSSNLTKKA